MGIQNHSGMECKISQGKLLHCTCTEKVSPMSSLIFYHLITIVLSSHSVFSRAWLHILIVIPHWVLGFPGDIFPPDSSRPGPSASPCRVNNNLDYSGSLPLNSCLYCNWEGVGGWGCGGVHNWMQYSICGLGNAKQKGTIPSLDGSISCSWIVLNSPSDQLVILNHIPGTLPLPRPRKVSLGGDLHSQYF